MTFKRKRNIKLDTSATYSVFEADAFNEDEIEDYDEQKATGMEEEEEREMHLQHVIKGLGNAIPLPVIREQRNPARSKYKQQDLKKFINIQADAKNEYVLSKAEQKELKGILAENMDSGPRETIHVRSKNVSLIFEQSVVQDTEKQDLDFREAILTYGTDAKHLSHIKNKGFVTFVLRKSLINFEKAGYEAYMCFKPRIIQPKVKSRKNESSTTEKLMQMYREFVSLSNGCDMMSAVLSKDEEILKNKIEMIENYGHLFTRKIRRKLVITQEKKEASDLFYQRKKNKKGDDKSVLLPSEILSKINLDEAKEEKPPKSKQTTALFENRFECELE